MFKKKLSILLFMVFILLKPAVAGNMPEFPPVHGTEISCTDTIRFGQYRVLISLPEGDIQQQKQRSKLLAIAADLLAGPLGGHRIYLGTEPWVPVVYAVTLGGGIGLLPAIDLFVIIFTKDLNKYTDNPQIIMWL